MKILNDDRVLVLENHNTLLSFIIDDIKSIKKDFKWVGEDTKHLILINGTVIYENTSCSDRDKLYDLIKQWYMSKVQSKGPRL